MKKFICGAVLGFLASWACAFATPTFNHNGIFWNRLSPQGKNGYVDGYNDAMQVSVGKLDSLTIAADLFHWKGANKIIHQLSRELSLSDFTTVQAVNRLDRLYANSKYSELDLGSALQLLTVPTPGKNPAANSQSSAR
ncbi:MAG: hypothetical protein IVW54_04670 [Candidatus Binataceae bacterium]|nr:hypothetical protein [Candidatus Binataceae bacterium]